MGRVMSLIMFCGQGLLPLSYVVAGAVSEINLTLLFVGSGVTIMLISSFLFWAPQLWSKESDRTQEFTGPLT